MGIVGISIRNCTHNFFRRILKAMEFEHKPELSVIMPAFNEGGHLFENIRETREVLQTSGHDAEIVVVDDGSTDNTFAEIEQAVRTFDRVIAARNPYNMGKGMALRTGFDHARGSLIVFLDADLDLHPSQINRLLVEIGRGNCDVVVTSKHHPESRLAYPFSRKVASLGYYFIIKILFGLPVRDTQTGLKMFRREVLDRVFHRLLVKTYAYDVELLATAVRFGFRICEIPVVLDYRRAVTWERIKPGDILRIFADTLAIFYRLRVLRYYDTERPPAPGRPEPVLVVTRGAPPSDTVVNRLALDTNTRFAILGAVSGRFPRNMLAFLDEAGLAGWLGNEGKDIACVGFLGAECVPLGSWVKNALRTFADQTVHAVCGPIVPGPTASLGEKVAAMLSTSVLTRGPNQYLHAITRIKPVQRGSMDNLFIRASHIHCEGISNGLVRQNGMLFDTARAGSLRYDPDVAVSRQVPPFMLPCLKQVARESAGEGAKLRGCRPVNSRLWIFAPFLWAIFLLLGWLVVPAAVYLGAIWLYAAILLLAGLMYLEPLALPFFMLGIALNHLVRAVAAPFGALRSLFRGPHP